jgi:hypothetical protein
LSRNSKKTIAGEKRREQEARKKQLAIESCKPLMVQPTQRILANPSEGQN